MPRHKLTYFDISGSRGEECRLALHLAGLEFEDERLRANQWADRRANTPFGSVPVLHVEGKGDLAQSNAILCYIGRSHGLHPTDPWEAARHEMILGAVEDLRERVGATMLIKDPDQKRRAREELAAGPIPSWAAAIERQLGDGPFIAGERVHVADLKLYVLMSWFAKGVLDHIPVDVFAAYPRLVRLFDAVKRHPQVADWQSRH